MKKIISILLVLTILMGTFAMVASARDTVLTLDQLKAKFLDGEATLDYVHFSPVKSADDNTKYPLVVWLHGNDTGSYKREQINTYDLAYWASDEYQSRFRNAGGAFILMPRDTLLPTWTTTLDEAKATIDAYVKLYKKNIDTNRIYVLGNSLGGKGAIGLVKKYPGYFAAVIAMSPVNGAFSTQVNSIKSTPYWLFTTDEETYPNLLMPTLKPAWNTVVENTNNKKNVRWTRFSHLVRPDGSEFPTNKLKTHDTWDAVAHDMHKDDGTPYYNSTTIDGTGAKIDLSKPSGVIDWLSSQSLNKAPETPPAVDDNNNTETPKPDSGKDEVKEENAFVKFFKAILDFFKKLFGIK